MPDKTEPFLSSPEEMRATCVMDPSTVGAGATVKGVVTFYQVSFRVRTRHNVLSNDI